MDWRILFVLAGQLIYEGTAIQKGTGISHLCNFIVGCYYYQLYLLDFPSIASNFFAAVEAEMRIFLVTDLLVMVMIVGLVHSELVWSWLVSICICSPRTT